MSRDSDRLKDYLAGHPYGPGDAEVVTANADTWNGWMFGISTAQVRIVAPVYESRRAIEKQKLTLFVDTAVGIAQRAGLERPNLLGFQTALNEIRSELGPFSPPQTPLER